MFKERIYKIWKQFTTLVAFFDGTVNCVQRTNIQNLKAIHNGPSLYRLFNFIVFKERIYKIWKQFTTFRSMRGAATLLCSKNEYTKSESNSQRRRMPGLRMSIVFKERIYKIWKQFTTRIARMGFRRNCVQRTNIQNLKAIHNAYMRIYSDWFIVFKERIYKIWKQFTTL